MKLIKIKMWENSDFLVLGFVLLLKISYLMELCGTLILIY